MIFENHSKLAKAPVYAIALSLGLAVAGCLLCYQQPAGSLAGRCLHDCSCLLSPLVSKQKDCNICSLKTIQGKLV